MDVFSNAFPATSYIPPEALIPGELGAVQWFLDARHGDPYETELIDGLPVLRPLEKYDSMRAPRSGRGYQFTGVEYLAIPSLVGSEVATCDGTAVPTVSAGRIDFTAGQCWNLQIDNGSLYHCNEEDGTKSRDASGNGNNGTIIGAVLKDFHVGGLKIPNPANSRGHTSSSRIEGSSTGGWGTAGWISTREISDGESAYFIVDFSTDPDVVFGITPQVQTPLSYADMSICVQDAAGSWSVWELGTPTGGLGTELQDGDVIQFTRVGNNIEIRQNGTLEYTSVGVAGPFNVGAAQKTALGGLYICPPFDIPASSTLFTTASGFVLSRDESSPNEAPLDVIGNTLQYPDQGPFPACVDTSWTTWNGVDEYILSPHLAGGETVVSSNGDSVPSVSAGRIDFTAGTCGDLLLSDGTRYVLQEGAGNVAHDVGSGDNDGTIVGNIPSIWANRTRTQRDWCIENGGGIGDFEGTPYFVPGIPGSDNDAVGNPKTLQPGRCGNPNSRLIYDNWAAGELDVLQLPAESVPGELLRNDDPVNCKFRSENDIGDTIYTLSFANGEDRTLAMGGFAGVPADDGTGLLCPAGNLRMACKVHQPLVINSAVSNGVLSFGGQANRECLTLQLNNSGWEISRISRSFIDRTTVALGQPEVGVWHDVDISYDYDANSAVVTIDGQQQFVDFSATDNTSWVGQYIQPRVAGAGGNTPTPAEVDVASAKFWIDDGLVVDWIGDEQAGTTLADSSGNGNDGVLTGTNPETSWSGSRNLDGQPDPEGDHLFFNVYPAPTGQDLQDAFAYVAGIDTGACDYPAEANVRVGVTYSNGLLIGELDVAAEANLPTPDLVIQPTAYGPPDDQRIGIYYEVGEADVRDGRRYGADQLEYEGVLDPPLPADVEFGVLYDNGTQAGNFVVPTEPQVLLDVGYGNAGTEFTGQLDVEATANTPAEADVRLNTLYGVDNLKTGLLDLPSVAHVRDNIQYDQLSKTGNLVLPLEAQVLNGVTYGTLGTELTGELTPTTYGLPGEDDVRLDVVYGDQSQFTGAVRVPPPEKVELGYFYDNNDTIEGTLDPGMTTGYPAQEDVQEGVTYGNASQYVGNFVVPAEAVVLLDVQYGGNGTEFTGTFNPLVLTVGGGITDLAIVRGDDVAIRFVDPGYWPDLTGATFLFGGNGAWGHWETNAVSYEDGALVAVLPSEKTAELQGAYAYDLQANLSGGTVVTLQRGNIRAIDTATDIPPNTPNDVGWLV